MEAKKIKKTHTHYEPDFKEKILRMRIVAQLNSGKMLTRYRRRLGLAEMFSPDARYAWKSKSQIKTETKTSEEQTTYNLNRNADLDNPIVIGSSSILVKDYYSYKIVDT